MKYAIISDVHGNIITLKTVLSDAEKHNVDKYIFVGDYWSYFPYPNEVVSIIKNLKNAVVIKGNEEGYLTEYAKQNQSLWTDGQFQSHYWGFKTLNNENLNYLLTLPKLITFADDGINITITHSSADVYGDVEHKKFTSSKIATKYQKTPNFSKEKLLNDIQEYIFNNTDFHSAIQPLDGVYIFGHTHVQWYAQYKNKTFINPGSCGLPLDGSSGAPYTLMSIKENQVQINERRVPYDMDKLVTDFQKSSLFETAPVWSSIILREMATGFEDVQFFLQFVNDYAKNINDNIRPFTIKTWT